MERIGQNVINEMNDWMRWFMRQELHTGDTIPERFWDMPQPFLDECRERYNGQDMVASEIQRQVRDVYRDLMFPEHSRSYIQFFAPNEPNNGFDYNPQEAGDVVHVRHIGNIHVEPYLREYSGEWRNTMDLLATNKYIAQIVAPDECLLTERITGEKTYRTQFREVTKCTVDEVAVRDYESNNECIPPPIQTITRGISVLLMNGEDTFIPYTSTMSYEWLDKLYPKAVKEF